MIKMTNEILKQIQKYRTSVEDYIDAIDENNLPEALKLSRTIDELAKELYESLEGTSNYQLYERKIDPITDRYTRATMGFIENAVDMMDFTEEVKKRWVL